MEQEVALRQMLDARERRAMRQWELLRAYGVPLISFSMNIAGPVKNSALIRAGFRLGCRLLELQLRREGLRCLFSEQIDEVTGCEAIYAVSADALRLKALASDLEDDKPIGRLFDMDVILPDGSKVERSAIGLPDRKCLICGGPARQCARSRTHSVPELRERTRLLLEEGLLDYDSEYAAQLACRALLWEVSNTPKPGLVDRQNSGSHRDMDFYSFLNSTAALQPYFARCCRIGRQGGTPRETFLALRRPGRMAECEMLSATDGVNTHKGAIFSLGILCGALGRLSNTEWKNAERILDECAAMTAGLTAEDFAGVTAENARTAGQRLYAAYGITGVRGQVEAGFPVVREHGLPVLEEGLQQGLSPDRAGCAALLTMLAHGEDTNLISRSDVPTARAVAQQLRQGLEEIPYPDWAALNALDQDFISKNLSPGGSADLLAVCWLLHFLKEDPYV